MELGYSNIGQLKRVLNESKRVLIFIQTNPDPDSSGSAIAIREVLLGMGKTVDLACIDPMPKEFIEIIDDLKNTVMHIDDLDSYDLLVAVDCGEHYMTGFTKTMPEILDGRQLINIDHHTSNNGFGTINIVEPRAAATCEVIYFLFKEMGWKITPKIATALLLGIYGDTGSFQHSNTSVQILRVAAYLLQHGADYPKIVKALYRSLPIQTLHAWGLVLKNIQKNDKGVTASAVTQDELSAIDAEASHISGAINFVNSVPDSKFSVILVEKGENVKGSLRTNSSDIDVARIAQTFGGGGHVKAAGFTIESSKLTRVNDKWGIVPRNFIKTASHDQKTHHANA